MAVPATQARTLADADTAVGIMKARMQLMATAMADALAEAEAATPGACERIAQILGKAREQHLQRLREGRA